jgi:paraquat-inducible protein A
MTVVQPRIKEVPGAIVCASCDAVLRRVELREREIARCPRCDVELERHPGAQIARILPLTVASLIVFAIANVFPIVEMELRGMRSETTLLGAVIALVGDGRSVLALMVLMTTLLLPLLHLLLMLWLLVPLLRGYRVAGFSLLVRTMQWLRPWGMIDIFLLGVLVALIKLSSMAAIVLGPALWAFVALTVLLTMVEAFDPRRLWDMLDAAQEGDADARTVAAATATTTTTTTVSSASATIDDGWRS